MLHCSLGAVGGHGRASSTHRRRGHVGHGSAGRSGSVPEGRRGHHAHRGLAGHGLTRHGRATSGGHGRHSSGRGPSTSKSRRGTRGHSEGRGRGGARCSGGSAREASATGRSRRRRDAGAAATEVGGRCRDHGCSSPSLRHHGLSLRTADTTNGTSETFRGSAKNGDATSCGTTDSWSCFSCSSLCRSRLGRRRSFSRNGNDVFSTNQQQAQ